jgi:hypothetical protein
MRHWNIPPERKNTLNSKSEAFEISKLVTTFKASLLIDPV